MPLICLRVIALVIGLAAIGSARGDVAVVVSSDSDVTRLSRSEAINIFMGRYRKLPNGITALPVDLAPLKARFYGALVAKDLAEINSYWARLVFSGQASPPQQAGSPDDVAEIVEHNRGAISYVDSAHVAEGMRVVLELDE